MKQTDGCGRQIMMSIVSSQVQGHETLDSWRGAARLGPKMMAVHHPWFSCSSFQDDQQGLTRKS